METNTKSILQALVYFDIFRFPLRLDELVQYARNKGITKDDVLEGLESLKAAGRVYQFGEYYSIQNDPALVSRRENGQKKALESYRKAQKNARLISRFPFVRGVFISGSMSKGVLGDDGDIDYFIVTKPDRLWISRTLLILYKKVFLFNSRKFFCVNYFVDEESLKIPEENLFTATEIITILPMVNSSLYDSFQQENPWVSEYYPNAEPRSCDETDTLEKRFLGKTMERFLAGRFGDRMDTRFMRMTLKRWQRKFGHFSPSEFDLVMKTTKRRSKHHPSNFQQRVLESYQEKLKHFEHLI